jgi:glycosyl transferase family 25
MLPPVFIISLPHETARQAQIAAELDRFGFRYEFFPATAKDAMSAADKRFYNSRRRRLTLGKDLYDAEIACMHSHKRVIEKIVADNIPHALVLEDDCLMCEEFPAIVAELLARKHLWHLVRFFGNEKHERRHHRKLSPLAPGFSLVRIGTSPGEAHCYLLDQHAARNLARALAHTSTPIDILMGQPWKTHLGVLTVHPKVAWQDMGFTSGIGDDRFSGRLHVSGAEKLAFRVLHPIYTFRNSLFKKLWYAAALLQDRVQDRAR